MTREEQSKDNVKEFKPKADISEVIEKSNELKEAAKPQGASPDPREAMTEEQIQEYMRREEEELFGKLDKFLSLNPKPDTSSLEEDEEEETFTVDLEKKVVTQKVGEGTFTRDNDGNFHEVKDPNIIEMVEEKVKEVAEPAKPDLQVKYGDMITERFVSKAIASVIERLNTIQKEAESAAYASGLSYIGEIIGDEMFETIQKRKIELRSAIGGGKVHYEKIPDWTKSYIDDHITNALNTLIDLAERD